MKCRIAVCCCLLAGWAVAQEIGYVETFSLADDREAALKELVPGTDDFYYYHALHAQNTGARERFEDTLQRWIRERNGTVVDRARELLNRQALLDYERNPKKSLEYLKDRLGLRFGHARKTGERRSDAPTAFDNGRIAIAALLREALADSDSLERLEDAGLALAADQQVTPRQRRSLLARLARPDFPGLVDWIVADLNYEGSRGFGSLPIHGMLTLAQMDELLGKRPAIRDESAFVNAYLAKLVPEDEVDLDSEPTAREAYYERVWTFVGALDPVHNSLKANVLYNRLRHDESQGVHDRTRFLEYVKLPRDVWYLQEAFRQRVPHNNQFARLGQDFQLAFLPPVPAEEPLVRDYLLEFFRDDPDVAAYAPYLRDGFLKPLFAEAKIVNGIGDPQQWAPLLSPDAYRRLKERVDIDFSPANPILFGPDSAVKLTAFVKNVPSLLVKVYELNTFNYYRETGTPLNLAINLDGLVASVVRTETYKEPSERRVARTFDLPELKGRGVFVVELIGNGRSSRALVQKGRLDVLQETTAAGHVFTVLGEDGRRVDGASAWLAGREFAAGKDGRIVVPYTAERKTESLVVRKDGFATLVRFEHQPEEYSLKAGIYVDRESLIRRERAVVAVRPILLVGGRPTSLKLLEDVRLAVRTTDLQGIATAKEFPDFVLREDAESTQEIQVPEGVVAMDVTLRAKVQNLSQGRKGELQDSTTFALNGIEQTLEVQALHVGRNAAGYYVDARGKNGEPLAGEPLACHFKHRLFRREVYATIQTDPQGRALLGALDGIERLRIAAAGGREFVWSPTRDACAYPQSVHGRAGEPLRLPIAWEAADPLADVSLLETRRGQFVRDWREAVATAEGFLELRGLPAGEYSLHLRAVGRTVAVRLTAGEVREGYAVSPRRALQVPRLAPLHVTAVDPVGDNVVIQLANASPFARVHAYATRYLPEHSLFESLGVSGAPDLQVQPWQAVRTFYESGRDIGDEYRYILDRQQATKFPGTMLERPGLLLNPWAVRATEAEAEQLAMGGEYAGRGGRDQRAFGGRGIALPTGPGPSSFVSLDFLKQPAVALLNLVPDAHGKVVVPRAALKGLPFLRVLAVDPTAAVLRCAALDDSPIERRELRLAAGLDPAKPYAEQKLVTPVAAKAVVTVADVASARFERCDTVAKAYRLMATLNRDPAFAEFAFVADWPRLDAAEQRKLYAKYACHELSFFLYHKDRKFFDAVVAPYLRNKKDKTFLDHWLLGGELAGYLEPWRFGRLNAVERVLLGKRIAQQAATVARDMRDRVDILPPDAEAFNRRFDTALQAGALETGSGAASGAVEEARKAAADKSEAVLFEMAAAAAPAPAAAPPMPSVASALRMDAVAAKGKLAQNAAEKQLGGGLRRRAVGREEAKAEMEIADDLSVDFAVDYFDGRQQERKAQRRFFQKLDKTQEWAENNYWHLPIERQVADLVTAKAFWADYAAHDGKSPFLSKAFLEATVNFTEMMLALAVLDLPFEAAAHTETVEGLAYTLAAASPAVLFHREIREAERADAAGGMLVAQQFFRADDRERIENGERFDKLVTDEFLPRVVYGAQVVLTNPTGNRQKLNALLQIPMGAVPVNATPYTRGVYVVMEPYSTQKLEYFFYFPATGDYPHYPVTVAANDRVVGGAPAFVFHVVPTLSKVDTTSWAWLAHNGEEADVLAFLRDANLRRIEGELDEVAWRMRAKAFFKTATGLLESRRVFDATLWSYGLFHDDPATIREFLRQHEFADQCGLWLDSPLLTLEPVERFDYQHLEYAPLVNPRAHQVGAKRTILNTRFREQYQRFMAVLSYKPKLDAQDTLAVAYYLMLQDRIAEAIAWFGRVDRKAVPEQLQSDYLEAYLAIHRGDRATAGRLAKKRANEPVDRWRDRFAQVQGLLDELAGGAGAAVDQEKRDQAQAALAASEPMLDLLVEGGRIRLDARNVGKVTLNFYPMDIELLFSRSPFLQEGAAQFSFIRPVLSRDVAIRAGKDPTTVDLPAEFRSRNVMVEALAGGLRKTQAYYANTLKVQLVETYGQIAVAHAETGKPVPGAYVKVYAKRFGGSVRFFKDGYTDLRGRFDYASLNTNELEDTEQLAILVLSPEFGAVVREAAPPKR